MGPLVFLVALAAGLEDPCAVVARKQIATYPEALACYTNFELPDATKHLVLEILQQAMPLASQNPRRSIIRQLEAVGGRAFESEFHFHANLAGLLRAEGMYYDAGCFASFQFHVAFAMAVRDNEVYVSNLLSHRPELIQAWRNLGLDPLEFLGERVVAIDGIYALPYLARFSELQGLPFNMALARGVFRDGVWEVDGGAFAKRSVAPPSSRVTFEFADGRVVSAPILVTTPPGFNSSRSFIENLCSGRSSTGRPPLSAKHVVLDRTKGAVVISDLIDSPRWRREVASVAVGLHAMDELVLDLRDSGGDYVCGSYHLINYLLPNRTAAPFSLSLGNAMLFQRATVRCLASGRSCPAFLGGLRCGPSFLDWFPPPNLKSRIKVVTNGICTGACAILAHGLIESGLVEVHYLGPEGHPLIGRSGLPYTLRKLIVDCFQTGSPACHAAPAPLPNQADLHFTIGRFFRVSKDIPVPLERQQPAEFIQVAADERLLFNPILLWNAILGILH